MVSWVWFNTHSWISDWHLPSMCWTLDRCVVIYHVCRVSFLCVCVGSCLSCSPTAQSLPMICFAWSQTRSDTFTLREDAQQNCLRNSLAIAELSELVFSCFLPYAHQLLSHVLWTILCNLGLVWILPHSVKMFHKTVYEMVLSQVLLYLGRGQYNVYSLSTRKTCLWEGIPTI